MGLFESNGVDDLDLLLYGNLEDSDTESQNEQIICRQGRGRGAGREAERTVPRLPQAAIHHRIALMESEQASVPNDSELRASSPSSSSQGSRRGRGRARTLRENAAAIPQVGLSRKQGQKSDDVRAVKNETNIRPASHTTQKTLPDNWLREEEFPTLAASNTTRSLQKQNTKPKEKVTKSQQDTVKVQEIDHNDHTEDSIKLGEDATTVERHNLHLNIEAASNDALNPDMSEVKRTEPSPKINKNNFLKQSLLSYKKLLPEGHHFSEKLGNRRGRNHMRNKKDTGMDKFVLNDDLPEYCKYEVTHDDILRHKDHKGPLGVPGVVRNKVSEWLNSQNPVDYDIEIKDENPRNVNHAIDLEEYTTVIRPEARDFVAEEKAIQKKGTDKHSNHSNSHVNDESASKTTNSNNCSNSAPSQVDSDHALSDVMNNFSDEDNSKVKELAEEINELELEKSFLNDLNTSSVCQKSFEETTADTSLYVSDEESNMLLNDIKSNTFAKNHGVDTDDTFNSSFSSGACCLSESDFVSKYQKSNIRTKSRKIETKHQGACVESDKPDNIWRLDGKTVIQVDGLNKNCVLSDLEEMVSGFGMVSDCEQKTYNTDKLSIRFKLNSEDACEFAVQCLHDTDCIFPDSNSVLECYKVG